MPGNFIKGDFMKKFFILLLFVTILRAQEIICVKTEGKCLLTSQNTWKTLASDMSISTGSSITTGEDSKAVLEFKDGHKIEVGENSIFSVNQVSEEVNDLELWLGELSAKIKKLPPSEKFFIKTPVAVCAVRGTKFSVFVDEDKKTDVFVDEGIVGVMNRDGVGEEVFVKKGEMTTVESGHPPAAPVKATKKEKIKKKEEKKKKKKIKKAKIEEPIEEPEITYAEEKPEKKPKPKAPKPSGNVNLNGTVGAVALTDPETGETKVYYEFSMYPELSLGKLGIGLELVVHFDENNQIKKDEWDEASDIYSKIDYIRWGVKRRDPFYILFGRFRKPVTIGHGFIVNNYTNMAQYPNIRKIGMDMLLDRRKWGLEAMIGDLRWREILAGRFFIRPLTGTGIPFLKNLKIASSCGIDIDPDSNSATKDDSVAVIGADAELPILTYKLFNLTTFADWAKMQLGSTYTAKGSPYNITDGGEGRTVGLSGKFLFLNFRGEYRRIESNFIPGYFDGFYDIDRWRYYDTSIGTTTKAAYYLNGKKSQPVLVGPYAEMWFAILNLLNFRASYENYNVGKDDPFYPHLIARAELQKVPGLSQYTFEAEYDKRSARRWRDIRELDENALLSLKIGYNVAPNVTMFVVIRRSFDANGNETKTMTAETRMRF